MGWQVIRPGNTPPFEHILAMGKVSRRPLLRVISGPRANSQPGYDIVQNKPSWLIQKLVTGRNSLLDPFIQYPSMLLSAMEAKLQSATGCIINEVFFEAADRAIHED
jgi:hypothetical protein